MSSKTVSCDDKGGSGESGMSCWILRLSNELLCMVLAIVADTDKPLGAYVLGEPCKRDAALGVLRLSEVCTQFRALLLSMPEIWSNVVFKLPVENAEIALARSKLAPLAATIFSRRVFRYRSVQQFGALESAHRHFVAWITEHSARIRSLSAPTLSFAEHSQILSGPLPQLQELEIVFSLDINFTADLGRLHVKGPAVRHASFVCDYRAWLRVLETSITFEFPALRSFAFDASSCNSNSISPGWIVEILQASRLLSHLSLRLPHTMAPIDWDAVFSDREVQLAHLQSAELAGFPTTNLGSLFKNLGLPRLSRCTVERTRSKRLRVNDAEALSDFADAFVPLLQHPSHNYLTVQTDVGGDGITAQLRLRTLTKTQRPDVDDETDLIELSVDLDSPDHRVEYVGRIQEALQDNNIRRLAIDAPKKMQWPDLASAWPELIDAVVSTCTGATELIIRQRSGFVISAKHALAALETILFETEIVADGEFLDGEDTTSAPRCWEGLVAWLTWRAGAGLRVRCLCITGSGNANWETYARAAEFVDELVDERHNNSAR